MEQPTNSVNSVCIYESRTRLLPKETSEVSMSALAMSPKGVSAGNLVREVTPGWGRLVLSEGHSHPLESQAIPCFTLCYLMSIYTSLCLKLPVILLARLCISTLPSHTINKLLLSHHAWRVSFCYYFWRVLSYLVENSSWIQHHQQCTNFTIIIHVDQNLVHMFNFVSERKYGT